jgi:hypothetical protein
MNYLKMMAVQKQIEHILANKFTPDEIADNYLNIPFDKRSLPPSPDAEAIGKVRIANNRVLSSWLNYRADPEQLINEILRAVGFYEIPVLLENCRKVGNRLKGFTVPEIDEHLAKTSCNLEELKKDIAAIDRALKQPLSAMTMMELTDQREGLQEVVDQDYVYISRQKEVALKWLSNSHSEALPLIRDFILARDPNQPEQTYTRALVLIVFRLLESHAQDAKQKAVGVNAKLTVDVITTLSPNLQKYITARTLKAARTGH